LLVLYVLTLLLTAALLFLVEPLVAKALLPTLGGGPVVWTTCAAFFQLALLVGYAYTHVALRWLPVRRQVVLHVVLLSLAWFTLPLAAPGAWVAPPAYQGLWLFGRLAVLVGLPFVLLSASAPLLQAWLAGSRHRDAGDPYFLYAASNLGSLVALLSYPLLVEPALGLSRQRQLWSLGFGAAAISVVACALVAARSAARSSPATTAPPPPTSSVTWPQRLRWLLLAMVPSSLLLSVTSYASTDLAALPLLWVVPLALYLLTFVIAFQPGRPRFLTAGRVLWLQPFFLIPVAVEFFWRIQGAAWPLIPFHILGFAVCALACHQTLAQSRPPSGSLTSFYMWVALGGALGGLFNSLVAPRIFATVLEYPLGITVVALLRPAPGNASPGSWRRDAASPLLLFALLCGVALLVVNLRSRLGPGTTLVLVGAALCVAGVLALHSRERPFRFGLVIGAVVAAGLVHTRLAMPPLFEGRSFFAVHAVRDEDGRRILSQGNTVHGFQHLRADRRRDPTTYYHRAGPMGYVMEGWRGTELRRRVAIVGLGTGTLAAYSDPGERWTFFEIDPVVIDVARDRGLFTFIADARGAIDIVRGDARVSLAATPDAQFGIVVVDAFTSDAIPAHLLTEEALALYRRKLMAGGLMVFHISNRYLDLRRVVAEAARSLDMVALNCADNATAEETHDGKMSSQYMLVAAAPAAWKPLSDRAPCAPLPDVRPPPPAAAVAVPWTDDRWSLWPVLRLRWSETFDLRRLRGE
jgi:hypothetical protein